MADDKEDDVDDTVETETDDTEGETQEAEGEEGSEGEGESAGEEETSAGEAGDESGGTTPAAASQSRRDKRLKALEQERNQEREARIRAETLAEERGRQPQQPGVDPEVARRQREEKLATMTPEERSAFETKEQLGEMNRQIMLTKIQTADMLDKAKYEGRAAVDPVYAKHAAAVEARLAASRRGGVDVPRETVLAVIVGEAALKSKPSAGKKAAAASRVATASGQSTTARSNSSASTRRPAGKQESWQEIEARIGDESFPSDMRF